MGSGGRETMEGNLFEFIGRPSPSRDRFRRAAAGVLRLRDRFVFFVAVSAALHLALVGALAISGSTRKGTGVRPSDPGRGLRTAFRRLRESSRNDPALAGALASVGGDAVDEASASSPAPDPRLGEREWADILEGVIAAGMRTGQRAGARPPALSKLVDDFAAAAASPDGFAMPDGQGSLFAFEDAETGRSRLYRLPGHDRRRLELLREPRDGADAGGPGSAARRDVIVAVPGGKPVEVPAEYYFRDAPYERILAVGAGLFYAVRGFPELGTPRSNENPDGRPPAPRPQTPPDATSLRPSSKAGFEVRLVTAAKPISSAPAQAVKLPRTDEEMTAILDGLMALPEERQAAEFIRLYLDRGDPDDPALAKLTAEFLYRNLGMVFVRTVDLAAAFDVLEELYYDKLTQDDLVSYWRAHPGTRAGAEVLFALASLYEFEARVLERVADSLETADRAAGGRSGADLPVHDGRAKGYVLAGVCRDLAARLPGAGHPTLESALRRYEAERFRVYNLLLDYGGDIRSRARFAIGRFHWDAGRTEMAMKTWAAIDRAWRGGAIAEIRALGRDTYFPEITPRAVERVAEILERLDAAGRSGQMERLVRFHVWETRSRALK